MRVRFLSGNQAGGEQDVPEVEGECLLATGFAERVEPPPAPDVPAAAPEPVAEPVSQVPRLPRRR